MKGLIEWLESYAVDADGIPAGLTMRTLGSLIRPTRQYSSTSPVKITVCGQNAWSSISAFADTAVRIDPGKNQEWGVTFARLITPFGDTLVSNDMLLSAERGMDGEMFILDPKHIRQLEMRGLPMIIKQNVNNASDIHNMKDVVTGTRGLQVKLPDTGQGSF